MEKYEREEGSKSCSLKNKKWRKKHWQDLGV